MGRSLREIYLHIVWGTRDKAPILRGDLERFVHRRIRQIAEESGLSPLAVNAAWNHVHTLTRWNTTQAIQSTVQQWKGRISKEWNDFAEENRCEVNEIPRLQWQTGCGIFSVSPREVEMMVNYVVNQKRHHRDRSTLHRHERW